MFAAKVTVFGKFYGEMLATQHLPNVKFTLIFSSAHTSCGHFLPWILNIMLHFSAQVQLKRNSSVVAWVLKDT